MPSPLGPGNCVHVLPFQCANPPLGPTAQASVSLKLPTGPATPVADEAVHPVAACDAPTDRTNTPSTAAQHSDLLRCTADPSREQANTTSAKQNLLANARTRSAPHAPISPTSQNALRDSKLPTISSHPDRKSVV